MTITINGQTFRVGEKMSVADVRGFDCPLCRTIVSSCFRAENVTLSKELLNAIEDLEALQSRVEGWMREAV